MVELQKVFFYVKMSHLSISSWISKSGRSWIAYWIPLKCYTKLRIKSCPLMKLLIQCHWTSQPNKPEITPASLMLLHGNSDLLLMNYFTPWTGMFLRGRLKRYIPPTYINILSMPLCTLLHYCQKRKTNFLDVTAVMLYISLSQKIPQYAPVWWL